MLLEKVESSQNFADWPLYQKHRYSSVHGGDSCGKVKTPRVFCCFCNIRFPSCERRNHSTLNLSKLSPRWRRGCSRHMVGAYLGDTIACKSRLWKEWLLGESHTKISQSLVWSAVILKFYNDYFCYDYYYFYSWMSPPTAFELWIWPQSQKMFINSPGSALLTHTAECSFVRRYVGLDRGHSVKNGFILNLSVMFTCFRQFLQTKN